MLLVCIDLEDYQRRVHIDHVPCIHHILVVAETQRYPKILVCFHTLLQSAASGLTPPLLETRQQDNITMTGGPIL